MGEILGKNLTGFVQATFKKFPKLFLNLFNARYPNFENHEANLHLYFETP